MYCDEKLRWWRLIGILGCFIHFQVNAAENAVTESNPPMCYTMEDGFCIRPHIWPEDIQIGDTVYIIYEYDNTHGTKDQMVPKNNPLLRSLLGSFCIKDGNDEVWWRYAVPTQYVTDPFYITTPGRKGYPVLVGERKLFVAKIQLPPVDEVEQTFWKSLETYRAFNNDNLPWVFAISFDVPTPSFQDIHVKFPIRIRPRQPKETRLMCRWRQKMLEMDMVPIYRFRKSYHIARMKGDPQVILSPSRLERLYQKVSSGTNFIRIKGEKVEPWFLVGLGNHTPGDPNCPETWQGWKELEESLEPSTMRDEIRMTRIVIQYCDTEDPKVLDELTEWIKNMNEIQRAVMAKSINSFLTQSSPGYPALCKLMETVRPFTVQGTELLE